MTPFADRFITLTAANEGVPLYVRADLVEVIKDGKDYTDTYIVVAGTSMYVEEEAEEVLFRIRKAQVKDA